MRGLAEPDGLLPLWSPSHSVSSTAAAYAQASVTSQGDGHHSALDSPCHAIKLRTLDYLRKGLFVEGKIHWTRKLWFSQIQTEKGKSPATN